MLFNLLIIIVIMLLMGTHVTEKWVKDVGEIISLKTGEDVERGMIEVNRFNNNEINVEVKKDVTKEAVVVFHSFLGADGFLDPNIGFMELYLIDDALRNSLVSSIVYVLPFIPYQRQDRMDRPRVPISAKRTLSMIKDPESSIETNIITFDMHCGQIAGFSGIKILELSALPIFADYIKENIGEVVVASPDLGGVKRARNLARMLGTEIAVIYKERPTFGEVEEPTMVFGNIGKNVVVVDDMIDTGKSIVKAQELLKIKGVENVFVFATHGIFSKGELKGMNVFVTDTILRDDNFLKKNSNWLHVLKTTEYLADGIISLEKRF